MNEVKGCAVASEVEEIRPLPGVAPERRGARLDLPVPGPVGDGANHLRNTPYLARIPACRPRHFVEDPVGVGQLLVREVRRDRRRPAVGEFGGEPQRLRPDRTSSDFDRVRRYWPGLHAVDRVVLADQMDRLSTR